MHKLGIIKSGAGEFDDQVAWEYPSLFCRQQTTGPDRLIIGPAHGHVNILLDLASSWNGAYWLLYVLLVSRRGNDPARYQSPTPLAYGELVDFCREFAHYFESDGRHHLWIGSTAQSGLLIYDNHNVLYAYGDLDGYEARLLKRGLKIAEVHFPYPHTHNYHPECDDEEDKILAKWNWRKSPLQDGDEQP